MQSGNNLINYRDRVAWVESKILHSSRINIHDIHEASLSATDIFLIF
jgi:hypothetical protein